MAEIAGDLENPAGSGAPFCSSTSPAVEVRGIVRRALSASLATVDQATGFPYASLVLVACAPDGAPVLLLSQLARHTRNLLADARASLLFDGTAGSADPLAGGRVTLIGRIVPCGDPAIRCRFLRRHPSAAGYADFQDFGFYVMVPDRAHYVGGFGRIVELLAGEVLIETSGAEALLAVETEFLANANADHADTIGRCATRLLREPAGQCLMTGIDPEGMDLLAGRRAVRLTFAKRLRTPADARQALAHLAHAVRGASPTPQEGLT
jgi:heme iron utilization protein